MKSIFTILFLGVAVVTSAQQMGKQTLAQLKESEAGSKILWFFDAVESGGLSDESIEQYFSAKFIDQVGLERVKSAFDDITANDGRLSLYRADRRKVNAYTLQVKGSKSDGWLEMKFYFEEKAPYKITGFTTDTVSDGDDSLKVIYPSSSN